MKKLYTILFFADALLLIMLAYMFLYLVDVGCNMWVLVMVVCGLVATVIIMILLLKNDIKQPPEQHNE